jgi:uncharacterized protein YeaO (DUF488 family)
MDPAASPSEPGQQLAARLFVRRAYEPAGADDGFRVLVDRLWPRGLRREAAAVDLWFKDIAPSPGLRTWFGHQPARWEAFRERYRAELDANPSAVRRMTALLRAHDGLTLLYAARDPVHNHAVVLRDYLCEPAASGSAPGGLRQRLLDEHARMLALLDESRIELVRGDAAAARQLLDRLAALHREHAREEQQWLFPALPRAARWPLRTYEAEHARLELLLGDLRARLQAAPARLRSPRQRLELADAALPLQHLLEHHFEREQQGLFVEVGELAAAGDARGS